MSGGEVNISELSLEIRRTGVGKPFTGGGIASLTKAKLFSTSAALLLPADTTRTTDRSSDSTVK